MKKQTYIVTNDNVHHKSIQKAKQHVLDQTCSSLYNNINKKDTQGSISYIEKRRFIDTLLGTYDDVIELYESLGKILGPDYDELEDSEN